MEVRVEVCRSWSDITASFHSVELPKLGWDTEGDVSRKTWIFRGHKSAAYSLEPSVEREARGMRLEWRSLEGEMLKEFHAKAPLHISPERLPGSRGQT